MWCPYFCFRVLRDFRVSVPVEASMRYATFLLALLAAPLAAQHSIPSSDHVTGTLSYDGRATLGSFTGTTDSVLGRLNGAADLSRVSGYVAARAAALTTGNGKRDRDQWSSLQVDSFPFIRYDLDSVTVGAVHGDTLSVVLRGHFAIHGVRRAVDLPSQLLLTPTSAHLISTTPLDLKDYRIGGLTKMLGALRMNPNIVVHIDVTFRLTAP
jgi:polyisoprenoid-binding protein YceI